MAKNIQSQIVDENDNVIGAVDFVELKKHGYIHRLVRVIIVNSDGKYLMQRRAKVMSSYANCWDFASAGHVDAGETYEIAATRELKEELGLTGIALKEVGYYFNELPSPSNVKRFIKVFTGSSDETPTDLQEDEVTEVDWLTKAEIKELIKTSPDLVTDGLLYLTENYI